MFLLIPWRVDVPQDRWPVMNWLILLALLGVFTLQIRDHIMYEAQQAPRAPIVQPGVSQRAPAGPPAENRPEDPSEVPGITQDLLLQGWGLKGLLGYMWLHGGLSHLLGNLLFLWVFGNAVCAKVGNLRYILLYVLLGVVAGMAHLLTSRGALLGASGAINGVVGMYLVLFYENEVTCLFAFWPIVFFYVRWFAVSGIWIILLWLLWDIVGALRGRLQRRPCRPSRRVRRRVRGRSLDVQEGLDYDGEVREVAAPDVGGAKRGPKKESLDAAYAQLGLQMTQEERRQEASRIAASSGPDVAPVTSVESSLPPIRLGAEGFIRTACACGGVIRVTRQYAGRTVRCPRCRQGVVVPNRTDLFGPAPSPAPLPPARPKKPKDDCIHFVCTCGKRMKAPVQYAGRSVKCSRCGARLKIPHLSA